MNCRHETVKMGVLPGNRAQELEPKAILTVCEFLSEASTVADDALSRESRHGGIATDVGMQR
jgi:hypothetical protein